MRNAVDKTIQLLVDLYELLVLLAQGVLRLFALHLDAALLERIYDGRRKPDQVRLQHIVVSTLLEAVYGKLFGYRSCYEDERNIEASFFTDVERFYRIELRQRVV